MVIKYIAVLLTLWVALGAAEIKLKLGEDRFETIIKEDKTLRGGKSRYYTNERKESFESAGEILISFNKDIDMEAFIKKYGLKKVKTVSKNRKIYLFSNVSGKDDAMVCQEIGENGYIRYAYPNWKREKTLY